MNPSELFTKILERDVPQAVAMISGNDDYQELIGIVSFYRTPYEGVLVKAEVSGLPDQKTPMRSGFFAMHIHEIGDCTKPFEDTGMHYNPDDQVHPYHAGDMPPLLSNQGYAWTAFYDGRITIGEILGKSLIIHRNRDDFTTQPAGESGEKIGCGRIERTMRG